MSDQRRRRVERDIGMRRIGRLTRTLVIGALAGTGILAAGFGNALHVPHPHTGVDDRQKGDPGLQPPAQGPSVPQGQQGQGPPVSVSGGS